MSAGQNYYEVLGVSDNATADEIKSAYRRLARKYHPDLNPRRKSAEERFKKLQEAYDVLSEQDARQQYDQSREQTLVENEEAVIKVPRLRFVVELNWQRKLSLFLWSICVAGLLMTGNFLHETRGWGLAIVTVPLIFVWGGDWLDDDDDFDISPGSILTGILGKALMFIGWLIFARFVGALLIAPLIMKMS
ncbi:MAG TPA: J domain-containing protein [Pyrinomonadaceae bacterium]